MQKYIDKGKTAKIFLASVGALVHNKNVGNFPFTYLQSLAFVLKYAMLIRVASPSP